MIRGIKHRWGEPDKHPNRSVRACLNEGCGLLKITRHEAEHRPPHWTEFWRGTERTIGDNGTPKCIGVESGAP